MKGISHETGDAFFNDRLHQTTIVPAEILFTFISDLIDPATCQKGNAMAKSHYNLKKRQKELAKKKKKEEKRQHKLEKKVVETDETEKDPLSSAEDL